MNLGDRVRERRKALGLSQAELARKIGYKERFAISKIERGQPIKQNLVVKLAVALDVSPSYLMGWADENGNEIIEETPLERLHREVGVSSFSEEEKQQIINYIKFIVSQRKK